MKQTNKKQAFCQNQSVIKDGVGRSNRFTTNWISLLSYGKLQGFGREGPPGRARSPGRNFPFRSDRPPEQQNAGNKKSSLKKAYISSVELNLLTTWYRGIIQSNKCSDWRILDTAGGDWIRNRANVIFNYQIEFQYNTKTISYFLIF